MHCYFVFIVSAHPNSRLRTGLARDLREPLAASAHATGSPTDSARLLYYEVTEDAETAHRRARQIRRWNTARRARLVAAMNPQWDDLRSKW